MKLRSGDVFLKNIGLELLLEGFNGSFFVWAHFEVI